MVYISALYTPMFFICRRRVGIMCQPLRMSCAAVHLVFWPFVCPGSYPSDFFKPSAPGAPDEACAVGGGS